MVKTYVALSGILAAKPSASAGREAAAVTAV